MTQSQKEIQILKKLHWWEKAEVLFPIKELGAWLK
jgi:hypothetical protein